MQEYDPNHAPEPSSWKHLDEGERIEMALQAHASNAGDALHTKDFNKIMHSSLHAVVETQIATEHPPAVAEAVRRLTQQGLKRHAAVHSIMQ